MKSLKYMSSRVVTKRIKENAPEQKAGLLTTLSTFNIAVTEETDEHNDKMPQFYTDLDRGLNVIIMPNFLDADIANKLFRALMNVDYRSDEESMIKIAGVHYKIPRKQTAMGIKGTGYSFSNTRVEVSDWDALSESDNPHTAYAAQMIRFIAAGLSAKFGKSFNYALINKYVDEKSKIGYHSDDERELGDRPMILGLSLGQGRYMYFQHIETRKVVKVHMPHNSLMIMNDPTNSMWKHAVPQGNFKLDPRVSLTFRSIDETISSSIK